jgi:tetratricopeptide (TPR) repeat protein
MMDKQQIQQYGQLIQQLMGCANGEELAILEANAHLLDAGLLLVMAAYSQQLRSQQQDNVADWLDNFAQQLQSHFLDAAPSDNSETVETLNQQILQLYQQGQYAAAIPLGERAVKLARERWGKQHPNLATSLNNLAELYSSQGRYTEAEPLYQEALKIDRIALPENDPQLATHRNNLAELYSSQGRYTEAEPLYQEALKIDRIALPENHPDLARDLNNLAELYRSQGRYTEAEPLFQEALTIVRIALPENHPNLATSVNNLAGLYQSQGRYTEAEPLYKEALNILRIALPENHPNLANSVNNIAVWYISQERYTEAEPLFQEALNIDRIALPENHPQLARDLNNLAGLYRSQGRYTEAEPLFQEALTIVRIALPENHPNLATSLNNLALLYQSQGRYMEALDQFQASLESEQQRLRYIFSTSSDRERREYLESNRGTYYLFLTLVWQKFPDDPQAVGVALDAVLRRKALTTAALAAQSAAIHSGRYPEAVQSLFQKWKACHEQIREEQFKVIPSLPNESSEHYQQRLKERRDEVNRLQKQAEALEKQLAKEIPELQLNQENVNRQVIAQQLPEGSALVEFVRFKRYDFDAPKGKQWQEDRYLAFVVMAHQPERVRLVDLGEAKPLDRLIQIYLAQFVGPGDQLGMTGSSEAVVTLPIPTQQLQDILCQPLIQALDSASHWFLAPDSTLNLLPFQILPLDTHRYLGDQYGISYLSAGRDLLRTDVTNRPLKVRPATILADPDYNWDGKESHPVSAPEPSQGIVTSALETTVANLSGFGRAVGTDSFGRRVGELLRTQPYLDKEAVSYHLTDGDCPRILAVATHGFYKTAQKPYFEFVLALLAAEAGRETQLFQQHPSLMNPRLLDAVEEVAQYYKAENPQIAHRLSHFTPQIEAYIREHPPSRLDAEDAEDAMYRAGIALAGANIWNQGQPLAEGMKGVLFAQDVASLDLWGNELSALIACQSGLGEVASGEGVFGLRRAFVVAGSKTLLMSLWSVPARATAYLMERFFRYLHIGLGRLEALSRAQLDVRTVTAGELLQFPLGREILQELPQTYGDEDCPLSDPHFWGAWVLQGDISPLALELNASRV